MFSLVTLYVKDLQPSLDFYHKLMDMPILNQVEAGEMQIVFLGEKEGVQLEIIASPKYSGRMEGFSLGFAVENIEEERSRLAAAGCRVSADIQKVGPSTLITFLTGPNGEEIELLQNG